MKKSYFPWFLFCLITFHGVAQPSKHVVLLSIDGFRPEMYLDSSWPTPNLRYLLKGGTYAQHLKSVFPAYTYPSHTAMVTGAFPARSGVFFNQPKGSKGEWYWQASYIKVPTLWQILRDRGLASASVMWPVSVGSMATYNIPEFWAQDKVDDRIGEARKYSTPAGLVEEIERNATGRLDSTNMNDNYFSLDANAGRMAAYIFKTYRPALLALHIILVDDLEHAYGREGDSVRLAVAAEDRVVGDLLETIARSDMKDSTTVIIVGDHGFCNIHEVFRPNILIKDLPARFIAAGGSDFLYASGQPTNAEIKKLIADVSRRLDSLPDDKRKQFRILSRTELDKMGVDSAAILALAASPGLVFGSSTAARPAVNQGPGTAILQNPLDGMFIPITGGHHGYDPNIPDMYTGFIAYGAGIRKGSQIKELCEVDIAPLITSLLGIPYVYPDGKLIPGILVGKAE